MSKLLYLERIKKQANYECEQAAKYNRKNINEKIETVATISEIIEIVKRSSENDQTN